MIVSEVTPNVEPYELRTRDKRTVRLSQSVESRTQHPIVVLDIFDINMQRQATVKIDFKDIGHVRLALQTFQDAMLEGMCDY